MKPTPYAAPGKTPQYPDYYILSVSDLVDDFVDKWDTILNTEMMEHSHIAEVVLPEVFTIGSDGQIFKQVYLAQHVSEVHKWHPDISLILAAAIENVKTKHEAEQDIGVVMSMLWVDVAHMADIQLRSNIPAESIPQALSNTRRQIAAISTEFGKKLYQRLIEYGLYKNGHFPYHYVGWEGNCAIVALDEEAADPVKAIYPYLE